jgi:hypothetical protein
LELTESKPGYDYLILYVPVHGWDLGHVILNLVSTYQTSNRSKKKFKQEGAEGHWLTNDINAT